MLLIYTIWSLTSRDGILLAVKVEEVKMKKTVFLWIAAIASAFFVLMPYLSLFILGGEGGGDSLTIAASILGSSIFLTAVFVLAVLGIYKSRHR